MTKRKPASSPPKRKRIAARVTKSAGTRGSQPGSEPPAVVEPKDLQPLAATLALPAECMVAEAASLRQSLAALLNEPQPVTLDVAALQRIDTAGLQVITAFVRERGASGRSVEWQGTAPVLSTAAQLLGLTSLLNLPA
jgi:ABC-type transporter Mla MlaB component